MAMLNVRGFMDNADFDDILYDGWQQETDQVEAFSGTLSVCHDASTAVVRPSLQVNYFGSDLFMYGTMNEEVAGTYNVDSGPSQTMIFSNSTVGKLGVEVLRLTGLPMSMSPFHILKIDLTAGNVTIDYFTYTPTSLTDFGGHNFVIDDQDPVLEYSKGWAGAINEQYPQAAPYLGTTTGTNTIGSSMQLSFNGEAVMVYGALQQVPGILTFSFSVDDAEPTVYTPWNGAQTNTSDWFVAWQIFNMSVPAGPHTLRISLQEATGSQMLRLDSIIVQAAFTTTLSNVASRSSKSGLSRGAIGGIASGLAVLVIIALLILRRCLARRNKPAPDPTPMDQVPATPTTPVYTPPPPPPIPEAPTFGPAPTTLPGLSLHKAWTNMLNQQHRA